MARPEVGTAVRLGAADPASLWPNLASLPTDPIGAVGGACVCPAGVAGGETGGAMDAERMAGGAMRAPAGKAAWRGGGAGWGCCGDDACSCSASCRRSASLSAGRDVREMARRRKARPAARARRRPVVCEVVLAGQAAMARWPALDLRGGRLSLGVEGMAWWSGDGRCAGWLCGVLMGNR
uniref:Uncharacterized protein n=1 Tax=Oryza meridionalis TaxID=40149 RepID=A0A0E0DFT2_9ORYZ